MISKNCLLAAASMLVLIVPLPAAAVTVIDVCLEVPSRGEYLTIAEGTAELRADRDFCGGLEEFSIVDLNGGTLMDGDEVQILTAWGEAVSSDQGALSAAIGGNGPLSENVFVIRTAEEGAELEDGSDFTLEAGGLLLGTVPNPTPVSPPAARARAGSGDVALQSVQSPARTGPTSAEPASEQAPVREPRPTLAMVPAVGGAAVAERMLTTQANGVARANSLAGQNLAQSNPALRAALLRLRRPARLRPRPATVVSLANGARVEVATQDNPTGERFQIVLDSIGLKKQRDRREDLYFIITTVDGSQRMESIITEIYDNLDAKDYIKWYPINQPLYFSRDPLNFLEITATMYDAEGDTAKASAAITDATAGVAGAISDYFLPGSGTLVNSSFKGASKVAEAWAELGDDDRYGSGTVRWPNRTSLFSKTGCHPVRYYERDSGFGDRGHEIYVTFRLDRVSTQSGVQQARCQSISRSSGRRARGGGGGGDCGGCIGRPTVMQE